MPSEGTRQPRRRTWRPRPLPARLAALVLILALAAAAAGITAAPAAASWWNEDDGVEYGWMSGGRETEYAWAQASDAALAELSVGAATTLACRAVADEAPFPGAVFLCKHLIKPVITRWISSEGSPSPYYGLWGRFYPHYPPHWVHGSYYGVPRAGVPVSLPGL